jgi:hypothetical protein
LSAAAKKGRIPVGADISEIFQISLGGFMFKPVKQVVFILLLLALSIAFAACGGSGGKEILYNF